jgi:hypothetical protein
MRLVGEGGSVRGNPIVAVEAVASVYNLCGRSRAYTFALLTHYPWDPFGIL